MESENQTDKTGLPLVQADEKPSASRRKLIQRGLVVAPILLVLKSTPVLAANCKLPSGFSTSGNLSRNHGETCTQPAHKPSWWLSHIYSDIDSNKFNGTKLATSTVFSTVFTGTADARTFLVILQSGDNFSSLLVSAYIGISASQFVSGVTITDLQNMARGTYTPPHSPTPWSNFDSENYLRYVMGLSLI